MTPIGHTEPSVLQIVGTNFSGRSEAIRRELAANPPDSNLFVGPYAETGLSGVATTVAEEIEFYRGRHSEALAAPLFAPLDPLRHDRVATLSGGQQVLLALACFENSTCSVIGLDGALEQLDAERRSQALDWISQLRNRGRRAVVVDNRGLSLEGSASLQMPGGSPAPPLLLPSMTPTPMQRPAPILGFHDLSFGYRGKGGIFAGVNLSMRPGRAYRLRGPNGSGKSTFLRLLSGVLSPTHGGFRLDGDLYAPHRSGNEVLAFCTQDPDHQWVATNFPADIARRLRGFAESRFANSARIDLLSRLEGPYPAIARDTHLLDLPKALRKRISWLWPLSGLLPWLALDEPTLGQDTAAVDGLSQSLNALIEHGYGVLFVSHDDRLADRLPHDTLAFGGGSIQLETSGAFQK